MKGQLSLEYMVAFGIFIGVVAYIYLSYIQNIPIFVDEVRKEAIRADAYQLSEILVSNPGEPIGWSDASTAKRIGFLNETANRNNFLSRAKIVNGIGYCNTNYDDFRQKLGTSRELTLIAFDVDTQTGSRTLIDSCNPTVPKTTVNATVKRIATYTGATGEVRVAELIIQV